MNEMFTVRLGTQDPVAFREVLLENEYRLPDFFEREDTILDIGAHIGTFAVACLWRGAGQVICVEPDKQNCDLLRRNVNPWLGQVDIRQEAVWFPGDITACLHRPYHGMTASYSTVWCEIACDLVTVPAVSLDTLFELVGEVRLLKLDCEGAEWPALFTSERLRQAEEIIGELHHQMVLQHWTWKWDCTAKGVISLLDKHGFDAEVIPGHMPELNSWFFARRRA